MRKIITVIIGAASIALLLSVTACKELFADIEEDFSYWASEPVITAFRAVSPVQTSPAGVQCVPSAADAVFTLTVHNPKNFSFIMPGSSGAPADIVTFADGVHDSAGTNPPEAGADYTLVQNSRDTLTLTYKPAFLKRYERSSANIGASIRLYSTDGRRFNQTYKFDLEANTPPKLSYITIGKTAAADAHGKRYYVIILKAEDMDKTGGTPSGLLHGDISMLKINDYPILIPFTPGYDAFSIDTTAPVENRKLLTKYEVTQLAAGEGPESLPAWVQSEVDDPWALRYKTDAAVQTASQTYTFKLVDRKGLASAAHTVSTETKAQDAQLFNGSTEISGTTETAPYAINAGLSDTGLTVTAKTATIGAIITGKVEKKNGGSWDTVNNSINSSPQNEVDISLPAPAPGLEILYKITVTAGGDGFAAGVEKVFYVKVAKIAEITVNPADSATWGGQSSAWAALKAAVENDDPNTAAAVIIIDGEIKAPNGAEQIKVNRRTVAIRGKTGYQTDKLNADNRTFIFDISSTGDLTLEKLTLQNGNNTASYVSESGGAIYCAGGKLEAKNVLIENCKAKYGGGIHAISSAKVTLKNTQIKSCTATGTATGEGRGGAIYCKESTLTLNNSTIGGSAATDGNKARRGGGIYIEGGTKEYTIPSGCTIQHNKATGETGVGSGGGGVYVQSGKLTLGGTISDNEALDAPDTFVSGGGVFVRTAGTFIMEIGATISGNKAKWGGGVYIDAAQYVGAGSFTMKGGTISNCHAGGSGYSTAKGGGVCIKADGDKKGSFTMEGGTITGCTAEVKPGETADGGGVYADVETVFKMSGNAAITPSSTPNTPTKSFNDVYLHDVTYAASIIVTAKLNNTAARLTLRHADDPLLSGYTNGRVVVKGEGIDVPGGYILTNADVSKFEVTPQRRITPPQPPRNWKVEFDGTNSGVLRPNP